MQENEYLEFAMMFLRNQFTDLEIEFHDNFELCDEKYSVFFSKKMKKFVILVNLEKISRISSFEAIFSSFQKRKDINSLIFCAITFKQKFILYEFEKSEKIYVLFITKFRFF